MAIVNKKTRLQWNLEITKGQGTGKICLYNEVLFNIEFHFLYFTITGIKKIIVRYIDNFNLLHRGLSCQDSTVYAPLDTNNNMIFKRTLLSHAVMGTTPSHARATSV